MSVGLGTVDQTHRYKTLTHVTKDTNKLAQLVVTDVTQVTMKHKKKMIGLTQVLCNTSDSLFHAAIFQLSRDLLQLLRLTEVN